MRAAAAQSPYGTHNPPSLPGFTNPARNIPSCYRQVLLALSSPGKVRTFPYSILPWSPTPLHSIMAAIAITFAERNVSVWLSSSLDKPEIRFYLHKHTHCSFVSKPHMADLSLVAEPGELPHLLTFVNDQLPFVSSPTTILVGGLDFTHSEYPDFMVDGPGMDSAVPICCAGLPADFIEQRNAAAGRAANEIDILLLAGTELIALPWRSRLTELRVGS